MENELTKEFDEQIKIARENPNWSCRFHPTDWWHEVGCPHMDWTKEQLQEALETHKSIIQILQQGIYTESYKLMLSGVDKEIRNLVDILNRNGFETVASCSGHGKIMGNIALKDGRELMIIENYDKARKIEKLLIAKKLYTPINK